MLLAVGNYLYVGTSNGFGAELWRCSKSSGCDAQADWAKVNAAGFGDVANQTIYAGQVFNNYIFLGTYSNNGAEVWRCRITTGCDAQGDWAQVNSNGFNDTNNDETYDMHVFNNYLYVFTNNDDSGTEIWRCSKVSDCDAQNDWVQVNTDGFGISLNQASFSNVTFKGVMYVGTIFNAMNMGGWLYKTSNGTSWTEIEDNGFSHMHNNSILPFMVLNNNIYATTTNSTDGGEIWTSNNGTLWTKINTSGFGNSNNGYMMGTVFKSHIYIGTGSMAGAEIWRSSITPLRITTEVTTALKNSSVNTTILTSSGTSPLTFSLSSGAMPPGIHLASSGKVTGKYTKAGRYSGTLAVTDAGIPAQTASKSFTLTVFSASIKINKNAKSTKKKKVKLTLSASDGVAGRIKYMRFSNNGSKWSGWKKYNKTYKNWNITSSKYGGSLKRGTKKVYVQFKNSARVISPKRYDKIRYRK